MVHKLLFAAVSFLDNTTGGHKKKVGHFQILHLKYSLEKTMTELHLGLG